MNASGEATPPRIEVIGITGIPEVRAGDELGPMIAAAASDGGTPIEPGDVVVVTQKIVSKAEGRLVNLEDVSPSPFAVQLSAESGRDPRLVELVLRESRSIVRVDPARGILITETRHGLCMRQRRHRFVQRAGRRHRQPASRGPRPLRAGDQGAGSPRRRVRTLP